jgi:hypothetical protein
MIKVYHNADFLDVAFMFGNEGWASKAQLTHVANVDIPDEQYGDAFRLTNHIDRSWQENAEVEALTDRARSTSVGDVIELSDGRMMICRSVGWDEYPETKKELAGLTPVNTGCPACSGKVNPVEGIPGVDAVCSKCGGLKLSEASTLGTSWCGCDACGSDFTELYYWREDGSHGWLCASCHGITQTG